MVETDVGYDAQNRSHYVSAVQTSPETGFQNDDIDIFRSESVQGKQCGYLKEGHVQVVEGILPLMDEIPDVFL